MLKRLGVLCILLITLIPLPAAAQSGERVELEASDGLILVGTYYALPEIEGGAPAVLLMHHGDSQKEAWIDVIPALGEAGYAVLTVDLRGHGETGGTVDWTLGEDDAHRWLGWLRDRPEIDPARVNIVGASIGGDVGLRVMAADEALVTIVAISPLLDAQGVMTEEAVTAIGERPIFLVSAQGAQEDADAARTLLLAAQGDVQIRLYDNTACCTFLFMMEPDLMPSVIAWLDAHNS